MMDITKTKLYIRELLRVMKSQLHFRGKPFFTRSRASDGLVFVVSGSCSYTFDDGRHVTVQDGDVLYLANGSSYKMDVLTESYDVIWCDFFFHSQQARKCDAYTPAAGADAGSLFKRLYKIYTSFRAESFPECMSLLYKIYGVVSAAKNTPYIALDFKQKMQDIASYILRNFQNRDLRVSTLAEQAGMSEVYFRKLFGSVLGCSPAKYITLVRLKNAESLLKYDVVSLEECAVQCGFSSVQYFNRVFKAAYDITPAKYRKRG